MANRIQIRRDTGANWTAANPTLAQGELGIETDAVPVQFKVGDGTTAWNSLGYVASGAMDVASSTLDDLVDGTTYKRIAAAVATALNAGNLTFQTNIDDLHAIDGECWFTSTDTASNAPSAGFYVGFQRYFAGNTNYREVVIWKISTGTQYSKVKHNGTWDASWKTIWDSGNDGNGGQPPAPKPRSATGAGNFTRAVWTGSETKIPDGGQWVVFNYDSATELWNEPSFHAGGTTLTSSNIPNKYLCWRITE